MNFPAYSEYKDSGVEWLGMVPEYWQISRLKNYVRMRYGDALASDIRKSGDIPVYGSNGPVGTHARPNTRAPAIIVGRKGSHGKIVWAESGGFVIDTAYAIDNSETSQNIRWLYYLLQILVLDSLSQDTGVPGLSRDKAYQLHITIPPKKEQESIANFLDRETARIDKLIAEKQNFIKLLKEKRQALISHVVTKGLNPNVKMKDSGIEWIGEVPVHWDDTKIKHVLKSVTSGTSVNAADNPANNDQIGVLKTSAVYGGDFNYRKNKTVITEEVDRVTCPLKKGTLIVSRMNTPELVGAAGFVDEAPSNIFLPDRLWQVEFTGAVETKFIHYWTLTSSYRHQVKLSCDGTSSTMQNISQDAFKNYVFTAPIRDEQIEIVEFVNEKFKVLSLLELETQKSIDFLKEHRTALISAAVTGKIDVRHNNCCPPNRSC